MQTVIRPRTRPWNDIEWRDRYRHIVDDDEHAASMLAEVFAEVDQRHPYALCGVSLVIFERRPPQVGPSRDCPECLELLGER